MKDTSTKTKDSIDAKSKHKSQAPTQHTTPEIDIKGLHTKIEDPFEKLMKLRKKEVWKQKRYGIIFLLLMTGNRLKVC